MQGKHKKSSFGAFALTPLRTHCKGVAKSTVDYVCIGCSHQCLTIVIFFVFLNGIDSLPLLMHAVVPVTVLVYSVFNTLAGNLAFTVSSTRVRIHQWYR